jgi:hypothetical protein
MPTSMGRGGTVPGDHGQPIYLWTMPGTYTVIGHDLDFDRQRGFTVTEGGIVIVPKAEPPETFQAPNVLPS